MSDHGEMDKLKGKLKEVAGKVTGDKRRESEGRTDQAKGKAKEVTGNVGDRVQGARDSLAQDRRSRP